MLVIRYFFYQVLLIPLNDDSDAMVEHKAVSKVFFINLFKEFSLTTKRFLTYASSSFELFADSGDEDLLLFS